MPGGPDYLPQDGFVAKVDPNTGEILFSSYIGGSENSEYAYSVAVDDSGNVFVAGVTMSHDFPVMNAFQNTLRGNSDGYLMKFNSDGELMFSTYFGGDSGDRINDICLDANFNVWVTGYGIDFPVKNPFQDPGGSTDGFVAQFNGDNGELMFSSPYGGSLYDYLNAITCDGDKYVYLFGETYSNDCYLPNAIRNTLNGPQDALLVVLNMQTYTVEFGTLQGGSDFESAKDIAVDSSRNIFTMGNTGSEDFFTLNAVPDNGGGNSDVYMTGLEWNAALKQAQYIFSSTWGGSESESPQKIAVFNNSDNTDEMLALTGSTASFDLPRTVTLTGDTTSDIYAFMSVISGINDINSGLKLDYSTFINDLNSAYGLDVYDGKIYVSGMAKDTNNVRTDVYTLPETEKAVLSVKKYAERDTFLVGDTIHYTMLITNTGNLTAFNVMMSELYDTTHTDIVSAKYYLLGESKQFDITNSVKNNIPVNIGDVVTFDTIVVNVRAFAKKPGSCFNKVTAKGDNTDLVGYNYGILIGTRSAKMSKLSDDVPTLGNKVSFLITVENTGTLPFHNLIVKDQFLSKQLHFLSVDGDAKIFDVYKGKISEDISLDFGETKPGEIKQAVLHFLVLAYGIDYSGWFIGNAAYLESTNGETHIIKLRPINYRSVFNTTKVKKASPSKQKSTRISNFNSAFSSNTYVFIDSVEMCKLAGADTGKVVENFELSSVEPYIHMVADGQDINNPVYAQRFDFYTGSLDDESFHLPTNYQLIIPDYLDDPVVIFKRDWRQNANSTESVDLYLSNAINNGISYNANLVNISEIKTEIANDLSFTQVSDYISVSPDKYTLELNNSTGGEGATFPLDLSAYAGKSLAVVIVPEENTTDKSRIKIFGEINGTWGLLAEPGTATGIADPDETSGFKLYYDNTNAVIRLTLYKESQVDLRLNDLNGRLLGTLVQDHLKPGSYDFPVNSYGLSAGLYIINGNVGKNYFSKKLIVK